MNRNPFSVVRRPMGLTLGVQLERRCIRLCLLVTFVEISW